jgi:hypothetical protein
LSKKKTKKNWGNPGPIPTEYKGKCGQLGRDHPSRANQITRKGYKEFLKTEKPYTQCIPRKPETAPAPWDFDLVQLVVFFSLSNL